VLTLPGNNLEVSLYIGVKFRCTSNGSAFNYTYCTVHKTLRNIQNDLIHRLREKLNEEITQCEICTMCEVIQLKTSIGYRLAYWQEKNKEDELQYECTPKSLIMNTSGKRLESKVEF
jgi:hypothetical protein